MRFPSCHGDPSTFSFKSKTCTGCRFFDGCVSLTHDTLLQLKVGEAATVMLERHARFSAYKAQKSGECVVAGKRALTPAEEEVAKSLPVKTAVQYRRIVSEGFVPLMKQGVASGINPFKQEGYKYLSVAFDVLLAGGFTKKSLRLHYMTECGWSEGTAFSAVSMIWHLFAVAGCAVEESGAMRPNQSVNNRASQG
jgi:hypothetical protein